MAVVATGLLLIAAHAARPGPPARAPDDWPRESGLELGASGPTLMLFFDPRCPCSAASLSELNELIEASGQSTAVHVVACGEGASRERLPRGVKLHPDPKGIEARRFGVVTSGQILIYDPDGRRIFHGGITPARGHVGRSAGYEAALAVLEGRAVSIRTSPVFGCELAEGEAPSAKGISP